MGWSIDNLSWNILRKKMKGNFAGCAYSMSTSDSPVIVHHRGELSGKEMVKYAKLFPKNIRVEFQKVEYEGEHYSLYGRGDHLMYGNTYGRFAVPIINVKDEIEFQERFNNLEKNATISKEIKDEYQNIINDIENTDTLKIGRI